MLDYQTTLPGYYPSVWPVECGGPRRQKLVGSAGLNLAPEERLTSATRETGGWAVMMVRREPGGLFLQCGAALGDGELPPHYREHGDSSGWLERIDPATLETIERSPALPSGGHLWCGAAVVHENGDLYVTNGRFCHRLNASCQVLAERELPVDAPYNGLLVMSDGNLVMKNLGSKLGEPCRYSVLEPERLDPVGEPFVIDTPCMGRFSNDRTSDGEFIYTTSAADLLRLRYENGTLSFDPDWRASYALAGENQSDGWDTCIGSDSVWMMDMGRPMNWRQPGTAAQRAFRFSTRDGSERDVIDVIGRPNAWNPGPPLYDPERRILVVYDTINAAVVALRHDGPGSITELWRKQFRNTAQMMLFAETGELVLEDSPDALRGGPAASGEVVVVDVESGRERGRAPVGAPAIMGMFLCPGFERDFYVATLSGAIARVFVDRRPPAASDTETT